MENNQNRANICLTCKSCGHKGGADLYAKFWGIGKFHISARCVECGHFIQHIRQDERIYKLLNKAKPLWIPCLSPRKNTTKQDSTS